VSAAATHGDSRAVFVSELRRYRRRAVVVRGVRDALLCAAVATAIALPAAVVMNTRAASVLALVTAAALVALLGAAVSAIVLAPSESRVAAVLDRALGRKDGLVTAVECAATASASDPVAALVIREGTRQLAASHPSDVLRFEVPRLFVPIVAIAVVVTIAATFTRGRVIRDTAPTVPSADALSPGDRGGTSGAGRAVGAAPTANAGRAGVIAARPADSRRDGPASGHERASSPASATQPSSSANASAPRADGTVAPVTGSHASATAAPAQEVGRGSGSADREARADRGGTGRSGDGAGSGAAAGGGGRGSARVTGIAQGAGGVGGVAVVLPPGAGATRDGSTSYAARYDAAWKEAQAAIARDRVPADVRELVRQYFLAIRPQQP
jgi:hypothetical protein